MRFLKLFLWALFSFLVLISMSMVSLATEYKEVQASEILKQIENGEAVYLIDCRIIGELNLSKIELETVSNPRYNELLESGDFNEEYLEYYKVNKNLKVVESNITIYNSTFENELDFSNVLFKKSISIVKVNLPSTTKFGSTFFGDDADFERANFEDDTNFGYVSFGGDADFKGANFGNDTYFGYVSFGSDADFKGTNFGNDTYFEEVSFGGNADFEDVIFGNYADLGDANFGDNAYFGGASFGNDADLWNTSFGNYAYFGGASFGDRTDFGGASFGDEADFGGASFGDEADFRDASFGDGADFGGASFGDGTDFGESSFDGTVNFSSAKFENVSLNSTDFKEMQVSWDSLENSLVFDGSTYVKLIQNFRNLEQFEDADATYYTYRSERQALKSWFSFSKWSDILMCFTCGYGVKQFRTFYLGGLIVLLFSFIYLGSPTISWCNREETDNTQKSVIKTVLSLIPKINWSNPGISRLSNSKDSVQQVTFWDSFYFSMVTFSTIGFGDWYPKDKFRKWVMIEGFLGWLTLGLFLVTLTNVMIRP